VQDGKFQFVNPQFQKLTGYSKDELLGSMHPLKIVFSKDRSMVRENAVKMLKGELSSPYEYRFVRKDGEIRWAMETVTSIQNDRRRITLGYFMDVTEHKQAEKELRESEERLRRITDNMLDVIRVTNAEGIIQYVSPSHKNVVGYEPEEILGMSTFEFVHPHDKDRVMIAFQTAMDTSSPGKIEYRYRHANGQYLWVETTGNLLFDDGGPITGAVFCTRDITERKRAEETLRLSEIRFSKAFNASPNIMAILTVTDMYTDGCFVNVNESFTSITGYCREEIIGRTTSELNIWADPGDLVKIREMILKQEEIRNLEINFRTRSGEVRVGLISAEKIYFSDEPCILVNVNDITQHKHFEKEMARLDQLNLVGQMAAGIGHEIRNPMTAIRGFLQMLRVKKEYVKDKEYFDLMIEELDRTNSIITEFLSITRNKPVDLKWQNLNSIVKTLSPLITADAMNSNNNVIVEIGDIPDLLLNEKEIRQLILNLVRNGLEAMEFGGNLTIRTFTDSEEVVLSVQDQGKGIDPDLLDKIGTPFFTTKENGTGMGLAVCYGITSRHSATIDIETSNTGATFFVRFSRNSQENVSPPPHWRKKKNNVSLEREGLEQYGRVIIGDLGS